MVKPSVEWEKQYPPMGSLRDLKLRGLVRVAYFPPSLNERELATRHFGVKEAPAVPTVSFYWTTACKCIMQGDHVDLACACAV